MSDRFEWSREPDLEVMLDVVRKMNDLLDEIALNPPRVNNKLTEKFLTSYIASLVAGQLFGARLLRLMVDWDGSWYVGPRPIDEIWIERVCTEYGFNDFHKDFVCEPTYAAISILALAFTLPGITQGVSGYLRSLRSGLLFASRELRLNNIRNGVQALILLQKGQVPQRICADPDLSPEMYRKLAELSQQVRGTSTTRELGIRNEADREGIRAILSCFT